MLSVGLKDIKLYGYHGIYADERNKGGEYLINIKALLPEMIDSSDLQHSLDYVYLYKVTSEVFQRPTPLLETIAYEIISQIRVAHPKVLKVSIRIEKLQPLIAGSDMASSWVELEG